MSRRITGMVLLFSLAVPVVQAETVTIRADEWFPMNGEPGSEQPGYMIELAQVILGESGHTVDYQVMPWKRALQSVREGENDCVVGAYKEDAPDFLFPQEHWGFDRQFFWKKKGNDWTYNGLESLSGPTLGLIGGYAYGDEFDAYAKENEGSKVQFIHGNNALENNIKKLLAGRIDLTVESEAVMSAKLKEMGHAGELVNAGQLGEASEMYIACTPAKPFSQEIVKLVDAGTAKLRADGRLAEIMQKYGLQAW